jgi:hypothetical protein
MAASRKISASCRIFLVRLRRLVLTRPSRPGPADVGQASACHGCFTKNLGIVPNFPWPAPPAGADPALRAWRCPMWDRLQPVMAASRKISASCRIFLGRLRRLVLTRPSGPGPADVGQASACHGCFTENLGIVPNFPWPAPPAGSDPALRAWRCPMWDRLQPVMAASRKISASCRIFLGRLRRLVLTRPSGPGAARCGTGFSLSWLLHGKSRHRAEFSLAGSAGWF